MATKSDSYEINVSTTQAQQNLARLNQSLGRTGEVFGNLKTAVVGFALGGFIKQTFDMANSLTDSAKAAGLSTATLLAFSRAVQVSGGTMESAAGGVDNFSQAVDSAATGAVQAQDRFLQLGITLQDLRTLSEEEIFKRTIQGLATIDDTSKRAAIAMSIMGRAGKGVEFGNVAEKMKQMAAESERMSESFNHAADARENINRTLTLFQSKLLLALEPISKLANAVLESGKAVETFLKVVINIGLIVASFTLLGKAVQAVRIGIAALAAGWTALVEFFSVGAAGISQFGLIMENLGLVGFAARLRIIGSLLAQVGSWALNSIPGLASLAGAFYLLIEAIVAAGQAMGKWLGITEEAAAKDKEHTDAKREVIDAYKKQRQEIEYTVVAFGRANKLIIDQINLDNQLIGKSKEYADATKAQEEIFKRAADESEKLRKAKSELSAEEKRAGLGEVYDKQIKKIQETAAADAERVTRATANANKLQAIEQVRLYGIQNEIAKTNELKTIQDDIAKLTLTEIEKKYYDIDAAAQASAKSAIEAEQARINRKLTPEEAAKYYAESIKGTEELKKKQAEQYTESRKFSTGWKQAMNEYVENATNGAQQAADIFRKATQGMEDVFINFVKTGKLSFKSLVNSLMEDMLRADFKRLVAGISGSSGSSNGGIFGGKIIPGFLASGGPASSNQAYIVGERGPELFVPNVNGTVVPNSNLGGGTNVTYNIQAVDASSFQALVARDPGFIHAVSEQGRRNLATVRR
jgi:lambda family phage tail tape measure protein